jgi:hypothetical protein
MRTSVNRASYSGPAVMGLGRGEAFRRGAGRRSAASRTARYRAGAAGAGIGSALRRRLASRWSVTTSLALMAVLFVFVDSLLTVEVQRISMDAHDLRKGIQTVSMELDALEAVWASKSSPLELDSRAAQLGLSVPEPGQVVLLQSGFMEDEGTDRRFARDELRDEFLRTWTRAVAMGIR